MTQLGKKLIDIYASTEANSTNNENNINHNENNMNFNTDSN